MVRIAHRLRLVCTIALAGSCLGTALPAHAGASLEVGYFSNGNWVTLQGTASGVMRICVKYTPPPPPPQRTVVSVGLQQIRVTDKRGQHTIPVQFDAGVPLPGGKAVAYLWRSFLDTNGPISIEADGSATTFAPPPIGSQTVSFTVSCSCESENLTVTDLTNDSALAGLGLVAFWPTSQSHSITAVFADSPDPQGQMPDQGTAQISLHAIGPNGLGAVEWSWGSGTVDLSNGLTHTAEVTRGQNGPAVYAPNAGATEADEDSHSWYSPYASVQGVALSRAGVTGTRTMSVSFTHTITSADGTPPSEVTGSLISSTPLARIVEFVLGTAAGQHTSAVEGVGPLPNSGEHWIVVTGRDGHGAVSKYTGSQEHPIAPAMVSFTIPPATSISGPKLDSEGGGEWPLAQQYAQAGWDGLGCVDQPDGEPGSEACFYSARHPYGQHPPGGLLDQPGEEQTLDALFMDHVVIFNGHGNETLIRNASGDERVTGGDIDQRRAEWGCDSAARLVILECCKACKDVSGSPGNALIAAGVKCVIGWKNGCPYNDPGYFELLRLLCDEGLTSADAYDAVCCCFPDTWGTDSRLAGRGDVHLWGVPLQ